MRKSMALVCAALLFALGGCGHESPALADQVKDLQSHVDQLQATVTEQEEKMSELETTLSEQKDKLEELDAAMGEVYEKLHM